MAFKNLVFTAISLLYMGGSLAAPVISDHSLIEYCANESSDDCELQRVTMNKCTTLHHAGNVKWSAATNGCWLYSNSDCSGDDKFSLPVAMAPFKLNLPMRGNAVYCASQSHSG